MTTQVIFKIDKTLKDRAMKKAQEKGIPFSAVLKLATKAFVDDRLDIDVAMQPQLNEKTRKMLKQAVEDIKQGKNLSPVFDNARDMNKYLDSL
ncbi:MAG: hypothetical protein A3H59_03685 [Candidatus Jacksonbacteria bacterium RIFCSPLOWO2_02_FULL_43_9]|nr:MAG: hypothetical protein A3H59_03685 [Candidatus Jacksonbacteria bacterium RIFCSPLOWO2_02_FULL_43_9]HAZ16697.1 hypothetical protein [Candidatus Jacksonbacteria bacterium]